MILEEVLYMSLKEKLVKHSKMLKLLLSLRKYLVFDREVYNNAKKQFNSVRNGCHRIYYLGIPAHSNLGDLAQGMCIRKWLKKHYTNFQVVEIETNALVNTHLSVIDLLIDDYRDGDFIVFQSGYTTTDLGGFADEMHRAVMKALPDAKMLMLPQTIFFKSKENEARTAKSYNSMKHMLFLARDEVSYEMAKRMFPDIPVKCYPDIVTTLIGTKHFSSERKGILMCCRDDSEKLYPESEITDLMNRLKEIDVVSMTDTTKHGKRSEIVANAEKYVWDEIENYSKYRCIITDRYHGTIFSMIASTPVIVIKSNDHKVTTGVNWFEGVYDGHIFRADDLNHAFELVKQIYSSDIPEITNPYFEEEYYDKLPELFKSSIGDD